MTNLEFIEEQIKKEQSMIKTYEEYFKTDKTEFDKQITRAYIQIHQKNISMLQQIKTDLEEKQTNLFHTERLKCEKLKKVIEILKDRLIDYQGMEFQKRWYDGEEEYHYFLAFDENFEIELIDEKQFELLKEVLGND